VNNTLKAPMISTAHIYLTKRLLFTSFLMLLAVFVPVLMIQLISQLPRSALSSELVWPALLGLAPTIFYITLPVVVGLANTWAYSEFATEGTLTTLYTAGLSSLNVRLPAFFVALLATMLGYVVSCEISPRGATQIENVVYLIENDLSPSLIEPQRFYTLNNGRRVIQYDERLNKNWIKGVFMRDIDSNGEEEVIFANDAIFERRADESWIILRNGHIQYRKQGADGDNVAFTQITRPTGLAGENFPKRKWTGYFEMPLGDFLNSYEKARNDSRQLSQWASEALERFSIPILALAHTMLGLALVNLYGGNTGRSSKFAAAMVLCGILFVHFMLVLAAEFASSQGTTLAIIVACAIVLQILISIFLFWRAMRRPRRRAAMGGRTVFARG
jgi:lipopolysaccharide export system permease protein